MRTSNVLLVVVLLEACGLTGVQSDAGLGISCTPATAACEPLSNSSYFIVCSPLLEDATKRFCPPAYASTLEQCAGGTRWEWLGSGVGPTISCVYVDGGLVGASYLTDTRAEVHAGRWSLEGCQPVADPCADAGACVPVPDGGTCVSLLHSGCPWTEEDQRLHLCSLDAGTWSASGCADGGMFSYELNELGGETTCAFIDGNLRGGTSRGSSGYAAYSGHWTLDGCTQLPRTATCL